MGTIAAMRKKMEQVSVRAEAYKVIDDNTEYMVKKNIDQLFMGISRLGQLFTMKISEDPYFHGDAAWAKSYADWKHRQSPITPYDYPNFYINGYLHSTIEAKRFGDSIRFQAMAGFTPAIDEKTNNTAFGLAPNTKRDLKTEVVMPRIIGRIIYETGMRNKLLRNSQ